MTIVQIERRKRGFFGWLFLVVFLLFNAFMLFSCVSGVANVSSTYDASSGAERTGAAIGTTIGIGIIMSIWLAGAVILGIFVLLTRGPKIIETVGAPGDAGTATDAAAGILNSPADAPKRGIPWWGWAIAVVAGIALLGALFPGKSTTNGSPDITPVASTSAAATAAQSATAPTDSAAPANWSYDSRRDEMRNATDQFAETLSTNHVNFGFPYEDGQMSITLRKSAQYGRDIIIGVHDGQFTCSFEGCAIHVKFDDGPIQSFSVNQSSDYRGDSLFIVNQSRFLSQLREAHRVVIEAQFYNHGAQQFTFEVGGLQWE